MGESRESFELFQPAWNFLGLSEELAAPSRAKAWVLPIGYEGTTSYGAGTRDGPAAIIAASRQVEMFDREFDCEPAASYGVHTLNPLGLVHTSPEAMIGSVRQAVRGVLTGSPRPQLLAVLGGEHSISAGVVSGLADALGTTASKELVAVQVDAHADLRDEYEGSPFSHACAARRILDTCPIFQIGIRNLSEPEERFRQSAEGSKRVRTIFAEEATTSREFLKDLSRFVRGKTVFLTIDLDGLDPSIMQAVGTPEPDGISWATMLEIARVICREAASVPVFDVVELAPIPGLRGPDFLAAKLIFKIMSFVLMKTEKNTKRKRK